jgi:hypothetical protein
MIYFTFSVEVILKCPTLAARSGELLHLFVLCEIYFHDESEREKSKSQQKVGQSLS